MPTKEISSNKSSSRRLNTGSALNSGQEVTPVSAEVGTSSSSTPSVSLRDDAESAEESTSSIGQPIMDTLVSVVPDQSGLVEPRISKRRDRSPSVLYLTLYNTYPCTHNVLSYVPISPHLYFQISIHLRPLICISMSEKCHASCKDLSISHYLI